MNKEQTNTLNMYDAVSQFLNANNSVWSSNAVISGMVTAFNAHLTAINASDTAQKTITTGITQSKESAKTAMANAALVAVRAGKAYAHATSNIILAANFEATLTDIIRAKDTDADDICQNIHNALNPVIGSLTPYGATAATQTALQNAINAFSALIGKPRSQQSISVNATLTIAQHFDAANALLKNQLDPIMGQFQTANATFYNQYTVVRTIVDIGKHHTVILEGFIYDATNHALPNAIVKIEGEATNQKVTDATGHYKFVRLHPDDYTITASASGYASQAKKITVTQNGTMHTDFKLTAIEVTTNTDTTTA